MFYLTCNLVPNSQISKTDHTPFTWAMDLPLKAHIQEIFVTVLKNKNKLIESVFQINTITMLRRQRGGGGREDIPGNF